MIYEPAEDSYLIARRIPEFVKSGMKVLDMGCGSGILAETAKKYGGDVLCVDINSQAIARCKALGFKCIESDLFNKLPKNLSFDLILFNPPYLPKDKNEDDESALNTSGSKGGYEIIVRFFDNIRSFLNRGGKVLFIVSSLTPKFGDILKHKGFGFRLIDEEKLFYEKLFLYEAWKK